MDRWFDRLLKKFEKMFGWTMKPSEYEESKSGENFKVLERNGPGFHMKIGVFNLTGFEQFGRDGLLKPSKGKGKAGEIEEEARKLALERFEKKKSRESE